MSMPAIERVIPLVGHLPASIREALARRLRELTGLAPDRRLSGVAAAALMTWSVQDPRPQPRDVARDPQHRRLSRRDLRRSHDADSRPRRDHADPPGRGVGLAHADPSHLRPRSAAARMLDPLHGDMRRALQAAGPHGGAWPLPTGLGGVVGDALVRAPAVVFGPPGIIYRLVLGIILSPPMSRHSCSPAAWARARSEDELTPIEDDDAPFVEEEDRRLGLARDGRSMP